MKYVLAIDQGTTSTRAIIFDEALKPLATSQDEFKQHFPRSGWVEHDPHDLWASSAGTCRAVIERAGIDPNEIISIGITNQRETTVVWDKSTGQPIYNAIVWQDRRTAAYCEELRKAGHCDMFADRTGLLVDPYFSATKIKWILDHVDGAREKARRGEILFGTVDTFLIWKLTGGKVHATDATNAARTMLYDIRKGRWSGTICDLFDIPMVMLPEVKDSAADFGVTRVDLFGREIPISGVAGDQQAATLGQACFEPGMLKATYGTGCFALLNTGDTPVQSKNRLLTTIAYQFDGKPTYALEGSIFIAGSVVQWLRDGLRIIHEASETQSLAEKADPMQSVVLVPAFTGLGAPYWNPDCRGSVFGLTRNSGRNELAKAALESVGYQTRDLLDAMTSDIAAKSDKSILRVDGGMSASNWAMQFLSDIIGGPVDRPRILETTALGVAWLAGMKVGAMPEREEFTKLWALDRKFVPQMDEQTRDVKYAAWKRAVECTLAY